MNSQKYKENHSSRYRHKKYYSGMDLSLIQLNQEKIEIPAKSSENGENIIEIEKVRVFNENEQQNITSQQIQPMQFSNNYVKDRNIKMMNEIVTQSKYKLNSRASRRSSLKSEKLHMIIKNYERDQTFNSEFKKEHQIENLSKQETMISENLTEIQQERLIQEKIQDLEEKIHERAYKQFQKKMESKVIDSQKIAQQVNHLTYKVRVQNGGHLNQQNLSQQYPTVRDVRKVQNLDLRPDGDRPEETKIQFENFAMNHRFRPSTTNGKRVSHQNVGQQKQLQMVTSRFTQDKELITPFKNDSVQRSTNQTPNKQSYQKHRVLMQQLKEIKDKFAKEESQSIQQQQSVEMYQDEMFKKSISKPHEQSVNTQYLKSMVKKRAKRFSVEEKLTIQLEQQQDDKFLRMPSTSNRMRIIFNELKNPPQDLQKQGIKKINLNDNYFDPLRLKILVIPWKDANPIGKNADYFFLKGFKYQTNEEYANALHSYQKGLEIKFNHLLCRFNLGVILYRLGLFEEAYIQYEMLATQGYGEKSVVIYNRIMCCLQIGRFNEAIQLAQQCIQILIQNQSESDGEIEMLCDMYQIIGLCQLRLKNIKQAGRAFLEAKNFKINRQKEIVILFKKSLSKQIQDKLLDYLKNSNLTQNSIQTANSIKRGETLLNEQSVQILNKKQSTLQIEQDNSQLKLRKRNDKSRLERGNSHYDLKIYLTDLEKRSALDITPADSNQNQSSQLFNKKRKSLPSPDIKVLENLNYNEMNIEPEVKDVTNLQAIKNTKKIEKYEDQNISYLKKVDKMTMDELLSEVDKLVKIRSDPDQCYYYIDDEKQIRLEKILKLPNQFESQNTLLNEHEKNEMLKRESIENYFSPKEPQIEIPQSFVDERQDDYQAKLNYFLDNFFKLEERNTMTNCQQKQTDEQTYQKILASLQKLSQNLDGNQQQSRMFEKVQENLQKSIILDKKQKMYQEVENQMSQLQHMIKKQQKKDIQQVQNSKLTLSQVQQLISAYNFHPKNHDQIDHILSKLPSFKNMSQQMRQLIILKANLKIYQPNDIIYKQGSKGECYYFLVRGCMTLISKKPEFGNFELCLKNYYDGDLFGEQPVLAQNDSSNTQDQNEQNVSEEQAQRLLIRESTCISNEESVVLEISNQVKLDLYTLAEGSKEYLKNLQWLRKLDIFNYTETFYLLQMVFSLEKRVYKYGEYLTKCGDIPDGMFIITKGQCLCVYETIGLKKGEMGSAFSRYSKQPKNFQAGVVEQQNINQNVNNQGSLNDLSKNRQSQAIITKPKVENLSNFNPQYSVFNQLKQNPNKNFQSTRIYIDEEGMHMPGHTAFQDNVIFSRLVPGDTFGMRTLLPNEELVKRLQIDPEDYKKGQIMNIFSRRSTIRKLLNNFHKGEGPVFNQSTLGLFRKIVKNQKTSSLSIFSDSNEVEVLVFKPHILNYIPENQKEALFNDIAKNIDPDNPTSLTEILKQKQQAKKWDIQKQEMVLKIRKSQFMERHKGVYKR